ncbi:hypothetical protein [Streptomyces sp. NBC_00525]|uniref:hypothetical protein n=1 Tax=Streptomyces sp. NBC_00525 TaxID=2903660 RepID=UPI002E80F8D5|nr:hypothetical protein [Streptomyces sp. NBC_00525]WUC92264.1 hypothetical protein OG710_00990 [Streptomyces sp. NBC_00525]
MTAILRPGAMAFPAVLAALVVAVPLSAGSAASADRPAPKAPYASVSGSAEFVLPYYPDDDIRSFSFDARADPYSRPLPGLPAGLPTDARGTVRISHYSADWDETYTSEGRVDCLVTGPHTATLTAVITGASEGGPVEDIGKRVGFSVYDGGKDKGRSRDRVGFSWNGVNLLPKGDADPVEAQVGTCMAPAAYAPVTKGGYTVRHAELPPAPKS